MACISKTPDSAQAVGEETGLSDRRPQQMWILTDDKQQQQQQQQQKVDQKSKSKKRSSTRLRTKFQIEALTVELSKLQQENQFLKETWNSVQQVKQIKSNILTRGDAVLEEQLRELHLDRLELSKVHLRDGSRNSERSTERKQYNYCTTEEEEEIDYYQLFS
mmetsp:Transcript_20751/g.29716  ORF Transcript_20751/g.29716 Transcript_20751/m.29716 type:complete len:162 (+) Transcript_20751:112-597(+)